MEGFEQYIASCICISLSDYEDDETTYTYRGPYKLTDKLEIDGEETYERLKQHLFILECNERNYIILKNMEFRGFDLDRDNLIVEFNDLTVDKNIFSKLNLKGVFFKNCIINDLSMIKADVFKFENCEINDLPYGKIICEKCKVNIKGKIEGVDITFENCELNEIEEINGEKRVRLMEGVYQNVRKINGNRIVISGIKNQILTNGTILGLSQPINIVNCDELEISNIEGCVFNPLKVKSLYLRNIKNTTFISIDAQRVNTDNIDKVQFKKMICEHVTYENKANYIIGEETEQSFFNRLCYKLSLW